MANYDFQPLKTLCSKFCVPKKRADLLFGTAEQNLSFVEILINQNMYHFGGLKLLIFGYTAGWNVWGGEWFLAINHHNHKNWVPFILTLNLWLIFMGMKQKNQNCQLKKIMRKATFSFAPWCWMNDWIKVKLTLAGRRPFFLQKTAHLLWF